MNRPALLPAALAALAALGTTGCIFTLPQDCTAESPCLEAGLDMTADAAVAVEPPYRWLWIVDWSYTRGVRGMDGVDVCGAYAECEGERLVPIELDFDLGAGQVCDGRDFVPPCAPELDYTDPTPALDDGAVCGLSAAGAPEGFVPLGVGGWLALDFGRDLRGCTVTVVEFDGDEPNSYQLDICQDPAMDCLLEPTRDGSFDTQSGPEGGGSFTWTVPDDRAG